MFPVGEASPHLHPLWQTAEQFGAVCTSQIDDQVTHVVANSLGTDKVCYFPPKPSLYIAQIPYPFAQKYREKKKVRKKLVAGLGEMRMKCFK